MNQNTAAVVEKGNMHTNILFSNTTWNWKWKIHTKILQDNKERGLIQL